MPKLKKQINHTIHKWHYWTGALFATLFVGLAVTGLLINHSSTFTLDSKKVSWNWLNRIYKVTPESVAVGYRVNEQWAVQTGQTLLLDKKEVGFCDGHLVGSVFIHDLNYLLCEQTLNIFTSAGELVERFQGFPEPLARLGIEQQNIYAQGEYTGNYYYLNEPESRWDQVQQQKDFIAVVAEPLPAEIREYLAGIPPAQAPTWERVFLDIHSGRIFGVIGVLMVDLIGLILLCSSATGLWMWFHKYSKQRVARSRTKKL